MTTAPWDAPDIRWAVLVDGRIRPWWLASHRRDLLHRGQVVYRTAGDEPWRTWIEDRVIATQLELPFEIGAIA
ncbi:hypothetical protein AB0L82_22100 [Nocardia sp. NPDC052001]|uniref:hypothetical protein n=1 Tax=Nocardia sp. NPDC052001 TaxID=3154853 RepID=UPI00342AB6A5